MEEMTDMQKEAVEIETQRHVLDFWQTVILSFGRNKAFATGEAMLSAADTICAQLEPKMRTLVGRAAALDAKRKAEFAKNQAPGAQKINPNVPGAELLHKNLKPV